VTPTPDKQRRLSELHAALGYRPLSHAWAKIELLMGLAPAGVGLFLGVWAVSRPTAVEGPSFAAAGSALLALGGYLALAGHRSHLYQSNNELAALLLERVQRLEGKG
jgi:hypothetical protein